MAVKMAIKTAGDVCGFILAAGFGTRLRPLTDSLPKPMIRFFGAPLLDLALFRLNSAGIHNTSESQTIAVNAHYLAAEIKSGLAASPWGGGVKLSIEDPIILGRGGAYLPLRSWFGERTIVAYNGDIISDIDVGGALAHHRAKKALVTMVVLPQPLGRDNAVYCAGDGSVGSIAKAPPAGPPQSGGEWTARGFACLQIFEPEFLDFLPQKGASDILGAYGLALAAGKNVTSYVHSGFWHDLGTPGQLLRAHVDLLSADFGGRDLLASLGLLAFHAANGTELKMIEAGKSWASGDGSITIVGPSAAIINAGGFALTTNAGNATNTQNVVAHLGPLVVAESGFSATGPIKVSHSVIYRSSRIDHRAAHSHAIYDHNHVITAVHK